MIMSAEVLASLEKPCKGGRLSEWKFYKSDDDSYYASSSAGKLIACSDVEDMRRFYKRMLSYGFVPPMSSPVEA